MDRLPETCSEIRATLPLFAGYDLEAPEMEAVAKHLESCDECRKACDGARRAREVLGTLRSESGRRGEFGPDLWGGVRSQLISEGLLESGPRVVRTFSSPRWWAGSAAAAAALVVLSLGFLREPGEISPTDLQPAAGAGSIGSVASVTEEAPTAQTPGEPATHSRAIEPLATPITGPMSTGPMSTAPMSTSRTPAFGSLVGSGGAPEQRRVAQPVSVPASPDGTKPLGKLRRLEPGELGLYEKALLDARRASAQRGNGFAAQRQGHDSGIR